jgi:hypothetical protein
MAITNGYCTLAQVKAALRITDSTDDTLIEGSVEAASRLIDGYTLRNFYSVGTATRLFTAPDPLYCPVDDLAGTAITIQTSTQANGTFDVTFAVTDYQLEPLNGNLDGIAWAFDRIRAVGDYAFPMVSANFGEQALVKVTASSDGRRFRLRSSRQRSSRRRVTSSVTIRRLVSPASGTSAWCALVAS